MTAAARLNAQTLLDAALTALACLQIAWTPVQVNDRGTVFHYGATQWVLRNTQFKYHAARTTVSHLDSRWLIHATRPAEDIETLMIGPLKLAEFIPPCSDEDTVSFHFELALVWLPNQIDSLRDFASLPEAISPVIHIPYFGCFLGYSERYFYSSLSRLQFNGWDGFVSAVNALPANRAFVIRIVPEPGSGVIVQDYTDFFDEGALSYSTNADAEPDFLDKGDPRIRYLVPAEAPSYHGLVLRGQWSREWGLGGRVDIRGLQDGVQRTSRAIAIPFNEQVVHGTFTLAIDSTLLEQYPWLLLEGRAERAPDCWDIQWRCDSLRLYWQP